MNVKKRLYQPELCKKQQDLHLSINLTRVFIFYKNPPKGRKLRPSTKSLKMARNGIWTQTKPNISNSVTVQKLKN